MVRLENFALLVLQRFGLCFGQNQMCKMCGWKIHFFCAVGCFNFFLGQLVCAKLVHGLCRNTAKLSTEFGRVKSLVKMLKVVGLGVSLMVVVSSFRLASINVNDFAIEFRLFRLWAKVISML
jgi:hypothetical protein